jgi:hypothetical protein
MTVAVGIAVAMLAHGASAGQSPVEWSGEVEVGGGGFWRSSDSARFQEYRVVPQGAWVRELSLSLAERDGPRALELRARHPAERDADVRLEAGWAGRARIELELDRLPHVLANDSRTIFRGVAADLAVAPADAAALRPEPGGAFDSGRAPAVAAGAEKVRLVEQRETGAVRLRLTPTERWTIHVGFSHEAREGRRALGVLAGTGFPAAGIRGPDLAILEVPEPIEARTTTIEGSAEYAAERFSLEAAYRAQVFDDALATLGVANPYLGPPTQVKLPDDVLYQNVTLRGHLAVAERTRLVATLSGSLARSGVPLLAFRPTPDSTRLDGASAGLRVAEFMQDYRLTQDLGRALTLALRYRGALRDNGSPDRPLPDYTDVLDALPFPTAPGRVLRYVSTQTDLGSLEATSRRLPRTTLRIGTSIERTHWTNREVREALEGVAFGKATVALGGEATARLGYRYARRGIRGYDERFAAEQRDPFNPQDPRLRKFDVTRREGHEASLGADWAPRESLVLGATYALGRASYPGTRIGRTGALSHAATAQLLYAPSPRLDLSLAYAYEEAATEGHLTIQADRFAGDAVDPEDPRYRLPVNLSVRDVVHTLRLGGTFRATTRLELLGDLVATSARGTNFSAIATRETGLALRAAARYALRPGVRIGAEYRYERYRRTDFALDDFPGPGDPPASLGPADLFLGARLPGYSVHFVAATARLTF